MKQVSKDYFISFQPLYCRSSKTHKPYSKCDWALAVLAAASLFTVVIPVVFGVMWLCSKEEKQQKTPAGLTDVIRSQVLPETSSKRSSKEQEVEEPEDTTIATDLRETAAWLDSRDPRDQEAEKLKEQLQEKEQQIPEKEEEIKILQAQLQVQDGPVSDLQKQSQAGGEQIEGEPPPQLPPMQQIPPAAPSVDAVEVYPISSSSEEDAKLKPESSITIGALTPKDGHYVVEVIKDGKKLQDITIGFLDNFTKTKLRYIIEYLLRPNPKLGGFPTLIPGQFYFFAMNKQRILQTVTEKDYGHFQNLSGKTGVFLIMIGLQGGSIHSAEKSWFDPLDYCCFDFKNFGEGFEKNKKTSEGLKRLESFAQEKLKDLQ